MRQPLSHFRQLPLLPLRLVDRRFLSFEDVDYNALLKRGRKLASLLPVKQLSSYMWIFWVIVVVVILVVVAVVFFVWHFRRQIFSFTSQLARQRMFGGHEMASFNRIRQHHEGTYEFPHQYSFQNELSRGIFRLFQQLPGDINTFDPEEFA